MRAIKFRAWNPKSKSWQSKYSLAVGSDGTPLVPGRNGWCGTEDELILMQFTGLHDKNGKEIWEGDVCKVGHSPDKHLVTYYNGSFVFSGPLGTMLLEHNKISEVLGNIYENPELLKP